MIQTFDYDIHYYPAMPVVEVEVKQVGRDGGERLVVLVDSGADATLIPLKVIQQLKVEQTGWSNIGNSQFGNRHRLKPTANKPKPVKTG